MPKSTCLQCTEEFSRKKGGGQDKLKFCSRGCATAHHNSKRTQRGGNGLLPSQTCPQCGGRKSDSTGAKAVCIACRKANRQEAIAATTLGELRARYNTLAYHAKIRMWARAICTDRACIVCGYDLHVDVCHVKPVKDFTPSTPISEVNAPENLVSLCPNHHWEFDNGFLKW